MPSPRLCAIEILQLVLIAALSLSSQNCCLSQASVSIGCQKDTFLGFGDAFGVDEGGGGILELCLLVNKIDMEARSSRHEPTQAVWHAGVRRRCHLRGWRDCAGLAPALRSRTPALFA